MLKVIHKKDFAKLVLGVLLMIIVLWGACLRVHKLGEQSYWIDEGYTLNAVISTLEKGYPTLDSGENYSRSILNTYLIAGAVKLGGFNPVATRSVAVIFGVGTIILVYFLGKRFFNQLVGLGSAALTAFSYWEIVWSRQARMYGQLQFFFLLSIYLFASLLDKFSYKKLVFLILGTLGAITSHYFGYFLLPIYFIVLVVKLLGKDRATINAFLKDKKNKLVTGIILGVTAPLMIWLLVQFVIRLINNETFVGLQYQHFLFQYLLLVVILALFGMVGSVFKKKNYTTSILFIIAYFLPYLVIVFSTDTQHYRYIFFILPILFIFATYALFIVAHLFKSRQLVFAGLLALLILLSILLANRSFVLIPEEKYYLEPFTPQPNFAEAYEVIGQNGFGSDKVIISPYTQMDKVYLGRSDYWLAIDLLGRPLDTASLPEREYYNNAITITSADQLKEIIAGHSGYIVVDAMALSLRLDQDIIDLIGTERRIYTDQTQKGSQIWVFAF
jgi:uncharacterized membrane protein